MRIALDVDGVLADVMRAWIEHGGPARAGFRMEDARDWDFWKDLGMTKSEFYSGLNGRWEDWRTVPPTEEGLGPSTGELAGLGYVDIVTARDPSTDRYVRDWLAHHGIRYGEYVSVASGLMKADLGYDVYIDDSPLNAERIRETGGRAIVYDQPWNRHLEGFERVGGLAGAVAAIRASPRRT